MSRRESQLAHVPFFKRTWILFLAKMTPDCDQITRLASESLERPLNWKERLQMRYHFKICSWCRRYTDQIALLHEAAPHLHAGDKIPPALTLSAEEKARLKSALKGKQPPE